MRIECMNALTAGPRGNGQKQLENTHGYVHGERVYEDRLHLDNDLARLE